VISDNSSEKSNLALRGQGANSTFIVVEGGGAGGGCYNSFISLEGDCQYENGGEENVCNWTGGYAQGSTTITLASCGAAAPSKGSLSSLKVGSILILDQLDETNDNGTIWNCENNGTYPGNVCAGTIQGGESRVNGPCNGTTCARSQQQGVVVTGISGSTISISPGLYMPNWNSSQQPQAWFASNTVRNVGLENLSYDNTNGGSTSVVDILACNQCWVSGVRGIKANRSHVRVQLSVHSVFRDSYYFGNQSGASVSYGMEIMGGWNNLIENNIFQQITDSDPSCTGACEGNVVGYNFDVANAYTASPSYIVPPFFQHASGDSFNLWEGNIGPGYSGDNIHGTHHFETVYRNFLPGWQAVCAGGACAAQTIPITLPAGDRYFNIVGNVMGQPGYHTTYTCAALTSNTFCPESYEKGGRDLMIYDLNYTRGTYPVTYQFCLSVSCSNTGQYDPQTSAYLMRWANYDVVTGTARFCGNSSNTGFSTTCGGSSEIPTALASYGNAVPSYGDIAAGQPALPASFYYASKPSWFGALPWPLIGPEVSGGNVGVCSGGAYPGTAVINSAQCAGGTLSAAWSGHANANAAMACFLNTMGGTADGTGSVLSFNATACYTGTVGGGSGSQPPAPANLTVTLQ
jgi:hypothetical protein